MTNWKKVDRLIVILILVLLGVEVVMETRYSCDEISITSTNTEKILRRVPEVSITEEDRDLMAELLEVPSVQVLVESGENGDVHAWEEPGVAEAAEKYLNAESAESLSVSALFFKDGYEVFLGWRDGKKIFYLQMRPEGDGAEYYKICSPKKGISYENWDNERAQKSEVHRRWFAWLRDGMWKDEA